MDKAYKQVREMHITFGSPVAETPTILSGAGEKVNKELAAELEQLVKTMKMISAGGHGGQVLARASWMAEEIAEFMRAETLGDQADALTDLGVFKDGTFVEIGLDPEPFREIVMAANLGKVWEDGKPRFDEQGKWIKPPYWKERYAPEPRIVAEIERQKGGGGFGSTGKA